METFSPGDRVVAINTDLSGPSHKRFGHWRKAMILDLERFLM